MFETRSLSPCRATPTRLLPKRIQTILAVTLMLLLAVMLLGWLELPSHRLSAISARRDPTGKSFGASGPNNNPTKRGVDAIDEKPPNASGPTTKPTKRGLDAIDEKPPYYVRRNASCLIFSCSPSGYGLSDVSLQVNKRSNVVCDRAHFYVRTVRLPSGETVAPHWCRVALLYSRRETFTAYETVMYVDLDVVYSEKEMLEEAKKKPRFLISYKIERGHDVIRTCWFVIAQWGDWIEALVEKWALAWRDTYLQDQAVFNKLFRCKDVDCVRVETSKVTLKHCGHRFEGKEREKCLWDGEEKIT